MLVCLTTFCHQSEINCCVSMHTDVVVWYFLTIKQAKLWKKTEQRMWRTTRAVSFRTYKILRFAWNCHHFRVIQKMVLVSGYPPLSARTTVMLQYSMLYVYYHLQHSSVEVPMQKCTEFPPRVYQTSSSYFVRLRMKLTIEEVGTTWNKIQGRHFFKKLVKW